MTYTQSKLATLERISPNRNSPRDHKLDTITIHCTGGQVYAASLGTLFQTKLASCNYGIGFDGEVITVVRECDRSWCTSSASNDNRAITIEVASDSEKPYAVTPAAYAKLLDLIEDILRRYGKKRLLWFGDKAKTLAYTPKDDEMVMTVHKWFDNKECPGQYLLDRHGEIAAEITRRLGGQAVQPAPEKTESEKPKNQLYRVRTSWDNAKSQIGAFANLDNAKTLADVHPGYAVFDWNGAQVYPEEDVFVPYTVRRSCVDPLNIRLKPTVRSAVVGQIADRSVYTIVDELPGEGSAKGWGKLKSGIGWISLDWVQKTT